MTSPEPIEIVLVGGPLDGHIRVVEDRRDQWLFPVAPPLSWMMADPTVVEVWTGHLLYQQVYYCGHPSRDDAGRYRFAISVRLR